MIDHPEIWAAVVSIWLVQVKIMYDVRDIKYVVKIKRTAVIKK